MNDAKIKKCTKCGLALLLDYFHMDRSTFDGKRGFCKQCVREYVLKNKARITKKKKEWRQSNRDRIRIIGKQYRANNSVRIKEKNIEYYNKNRLKIYSKAAYYRSKNKEKIATYSKSPEFKDRQIKYIEKNKEKIAARMRIYRKNNIEKAREYNKIYYKNQTQEVKDKKIITTFMRKGGVRNIENVPLNLFELKTAHLLLKRALKSSLS